MGSPHPKDDFTDLTLKMNHIKKDVLFYNMNILSENWQKGKCCVYHDHYKKCNGYYMDEFRQTIIFRDYQHPNRNVE